MERERKRENKHSERYKVRYDVSATPINFIAETERYISQRRGI